MIGRHKISIWFIIGLQLLIYGIIILISNIYDYISPFAQNTIVLSELHFGIWWGAILVIIGLIYFFSFRPWKKA